MATTYTVKKGDTLSEIAAKYNTTVAKLVELNDIDNPNYIVIGQVLIISGSSPKPSNKTGTSRATVHMFGLQSNSDSTLYAAWKWTSSNTENYQVIWYYDTGDGIWFVGNDSTVTVKQCTYSIPSNAQRVKFKVKPISKKRTVNKTETSYWVAGWSTEKIYNVKDNPPSTPSVPTVSIDSYYKLTAILDNLDVNATGIEFQIVQDNKKTYKTGKATINTTHVTYVCTVDAEHTYKVRCRSYRGNEYSNWSDYSSEIKTIPGTPDGITKLEATSETSVYLEWKSVASATSYDIEYTTEKRYFDGSDQVTSETGIEYSHYEKTGLESGREYFFRVRSVNDKGHSAWSAINSIIIGKEPSAPTTWSSTTTVVTGEPLKLYWIHNAEDGSSQTFAELELIIGDKSEVITIQNSTAEEEKDRTSVYSIDTSEYLEGTKIQWKVRTSGVTNVYGDWSTQRTIDVYAPPTLVLSVMDANNEAIENLTSFPIKMEATAGPDTQTPIGYHLSVVANESYETIDHIGKSKFVNKGETVYSKFFDISDDLSVELSAGDLDLENNISYGIKCVVSMNSGLTAEGTYDFIVAWSDDEYEPTAEVGIDTDTLSAFIRPYCDKEDVLLSVYRREFDGSFTEIATNIANTNDAFVTDPHPALDYARYRIVATTIDTGTVTYCDLPAYPVGEKAIIIQWDEEWSTFNSEYEDRFEKPPWSGSMLRLPYNVDVADNNDKDVTLVKYAGREHPVSYYGTHLGVSSNWKVAIDKKDEDTLYALRRLARWMGDVYVREPSGSGYWANISVSFSQTHRVLTIPVTIAVKRVEGGM